MMSDQTPNLSAGRTYGTAHVVAVTYAGMGCAHINSGSARLVCVPPARNAALSVRAIKLFAITRIITVKAVKVKGLQ